MVGAFGVQLAGHTTQYKNQYNRHQIQQHAYNCNCFSAANICKYLVKKVNKIIDKFWQKNSSCEINLNSR